MKQFLKWAWDHPIDFFTGFLIGTSAATVLILTVLLLVMS